MYLSEKLRGAQVRDLARKKSKRIFLMWLITLSAITTISIKEEVFSVNCSKIFSGKYSCDLLFCLTQRSGGKNLHEQGHGYLLLPISFHESIYCL